MTFTGTKVLSQKSFIITIGVLRFVFLSKKKLFGDKVLKNFFKLYLG
jgi:hypothetical protein